MLIECLTNQNSFLIGVGCNILSKATAAYVVEYFPDKYQALATCLSTCGVSIGLFN